ncbi:MAG: 16S rRNA (cytidine(1402)-2'-O)-methyltransferase [Elusimicrobia bacterium]|nr:16S rRNA (cytidine(1402)-2'-O)-methyltransferase [Elusimicrobiota bacterium]
MLLPNNREEKSKGKLYVVATPIGNLGDITLRAIEVLKTVSLIICEDTRTTRKLLNHYGIRRRVCSYYSPRETVQAIKYLDMLNEGRDIAVISESGTPCISDPGLEIVKGAYERGITVIPVPGPSAFVTALSASGISAREVFFSGFIPRKKEERKKYLAKHLGKDYTFVFYDSKYRIKDTIGYIKDISPDVNICIGRELTKKFEECIRGTAGEIETKVSGNDNIKGEFVVICAGK